MQAQEALTEIEKVASRRKDCDVTALSCCTKLGQLADGAMRVAQSPAEFKLLRQVRDIAGSNVDANTRMEVIAALCAQAKVREAA